MSETIIPVVGMGVTQGVGSDRYPFTVVEVINERRIVVQADEFVRTDHNGLSESQEYSYTPNPDARKIVLSKRKSGVWREVRTSDGNFYPGHREAYLDPSF